MKQRIAFICIFIFALLGMAISIFLTDFHYKLLAERESTEGTICSLSKSFNCDLVNSSPYSELFSIPIALWGLFFYLIFFTIVSWSLRTTEQTSFSVILHFLAIWSVLYSIYLFYIAEFVIGALCPYCIMLYAVNIGLFVSTKIYMAKSYKEMAVYFHSFFSKKENPFKV